MKAALPLLLLGAALHYGYALLPQEMQARAWNVAGAGARLALLLALVWHMRSRAVLLVTVWFAAEELLVIGCNTAFLIDPWPVHGSACSGLLSFDFGKLGLAAVVLLLARVAKN